MAKADSATGKQIWRTYLWNGNTSDAWIGNTNLNILPNGNIVEAWSTHIVLLDGDTGLILKENTLPSGAAAPPRRKFQAPDDRAGRNVDPEGPDPSRRLQTPGHPGDHVLPSRNISRPIRNWWR